jgi:hypothetical protein
MSNECLTTFFFDPSSSRRIALHCQLRIFFLLRALRMRTLKHRLLCALNHFRSVEKKLVYDDWGYAFEDKLQFFNASTASSTENGADHASGNASGNANANGNGNANASGAKGGGHKSSSATALSTPLDPSGALPVMPGYNQVGHPAVQKMLGSGGGKDSGTKSTSDLGAAAGAKQEGAGSGASSSSSSSSSSSATPQPYFQARHFHPEKYRIFCLNHLSFSTHVMCVCVTCSFCLNVAAI